MSSAVDAPQIKSASLYVGDLHPLVSDALLFTKFSELGPVVNSRVCRDMVSRESLGYGYVNFRDPKDAEHALEYLNYGVFFGRPFRLMWSQKDPSLRRSGKGNIFIKNLDKSITPSELYDTFEQFGKILSCKLATDDKGVSKGFGFVHFETEESAQKAISYVNGRDIRGRILFVGPFVSRGDRKSPEGASKFNNCYVKNFGEEMDDERFRKMFEKYGQIKSACVMVNDAKVSKGFGFVCFEDPSSAEEAVREMDGQEINGKPIYVGRAQRKEERQEELRARYEKKRSELKTCFSNDVNLYVKNLDDSVDDEKLHALFSKFGDITSAKIMRDANGMSRSFGFVCFRSREHAALAVTQMNLYVLNNNKRLYVALAQRKDDRRAKLTTEYQSRMEQMRNGLYQMHPSIPFLPTAHTAGFQTNRAFYNRQYPASTPRWQIPNNGLQLSGGQPYQAGIAPQTPAPQIHSLMQLRSNPVGGATMAGRIGPGPAPNVGLGGTQMGHMPQYRQNATRQLAAGGMNPPAAIQSRVGMQVSQNVPMMSNRNVPQMNQIPQAGAAMQVRGNSQLRSGGMQSQNVLKDATDEEKESQKTVLGNRLYQIVEGKYPDHAAKITGMLLSMDIKQVTELFDDQAALDSGVKKAYAMIMDKNNENAGNTEGDDIKAK